MRFHADLHIHSKYSRACSKDCDLEHLTWWARRKGVGVVGTGDFTHPAWFAHLRENLVPAEPGLFQLRPDLDRDIVRRLPPRTAASEVRFMLSVEISTIYKRGDKTRKVHHLVYVPDFDAAAEFNRQLGRIGNLGSDGRPILGLDSRDLLDITLSCGEGAYLVPAHVWTPWFAVLGSKSGFDAIEDCYLDLADHIFAVETGLSSDPAMNWRISALDRYRMVSNSDAHSPPMLGRETTVFDTDRDYFSIRRALETGVGYAGSVEFFPEEGKYHVDGHRKCGVRLSPAETREVAGICPECRKPLTVGVLSRVEELADRPDGYRPEGVPDFLSFVPLPEIMSEILGVGPKSKKVLGEINRATAELGPELTILEQVPIEDLRSHSTLLAEAVDRLRRGEVIRDAGYDGEYGVIRLFEKGELDRVATIGAPTLFEDSPVDASKEFTEVRENSEKPKSSKKTAKPTIGDQPDLFGFDEDPPAPEEEPVEVSLWPELSASPMLDGLDADQRAAAEITEGPLLIIAGPGTGKTRTLTHRLAHLVTSGGVAPEHCLAITFTRRAASELAERLAALTPDHADAITTATFHSLGHHILRQQYARVGLSPDFRIADQTEQLAVATEITGDEREARRLLAAISRHRRTGDDGDSDVGESAQQYVKALRQRDLVDFDDLIALTVTLLEAEPDVAAAYRDRFRWISVDEYQDVDDQQYRLLRQLAPTDGNLTAIGDPDQAIYRFRGADVGFFLRFEQDFPTARKVHLTRNYRSSANILTGATGLIAPTTLVPDRVLRPTGTWQGVRIGVHQAASEQAEATFVARTIEQLIGGASFHAFDSGWVESDGSRSLDFSDFAVLYRTDRVSRPIVDALTRSGMPFQKRSHDRLTDRTGVDPLLRELAYASSAPIAIGERLVRAAEEILARVPESGDEPDPTSVSAADIHTAVELLKPLAERCGTDIDRFRAELALGQEVDTWDPRADRISLLTLHAAKGLEFPVVFVVGCEDGLLPLRWPGTDPAEEAEQVLEERRLTFVGMTRARQNLYLSHAAERSRQGTILPARRSPFLDDIDPAVCEQIGDITPRRKKRDRQLRLI